MNFEKESMDKKKIYNVVAGILVYEGRILCGKRGKGYFESQWEFPGGKIEDGELKQEALKREIQEELGYRIDNSVFYTTTEVGYEEFLIHLDTYVVRCDSCEVTTKVHQELRWLCTSELLQYDWCDADLIVVKKIIEDGGTDSLTKKDSSR